jgi:hypothetical protein
MISWAATLSSMKPGLREKAGAAVGAGVVEAASAVAAVGGEEAVVVAVAAVAEAGIVTAGIVVVAVETVAGNRTETLNNPKFHLGSPVHRAPRLFRFLLFNSLMEEFFPLERDVTNITNQRFIK